MFYFFFFTLFFVIINGFTTNLNNYQWKLIRSILNNPKITEKSRERQQIDLLLFSKYRTWAIHKSYVFKRFHRYKCRNINVEDLITYSLTGLYKATKQYNGSYSFHTYANIYILGELYKGLTELQPITILPKSIRRSKMKNEHKFFYKKLLNTQFIGFDQYWMFEKRQPIYSFHNEKRSIEDIWEKIELDPFSKRVFQYKYDVSFQKIRSDKHISKLMSCSEETIRMNLKKTRETLQKIYPNIIK